MLQYFYFYFIYFEAALFVFDLPKLYDLYHKVISKCPYTIDSTVIQAMGNDYVIQMKMDYYMPFINYIINF